LDRVAWEAPGLQAAGPKRNLFGAHTDLDDKEIQNQMEEKTTKNTKMQNKMETTNNNSNKQSQYQQQ
jgi:hypothetical protein